MAALIEILTKKNTKIAEYKVLIQSIQSRILI